MDTQARKQLLERTALVLSAGIIALGVWFWSGQVVEAVELLRMAYGE